MEQEMPVKSGHAISMVPPPSYQETKNKTNSFLIAIVAMTIATLLVASFGVFYQMAHKQSPAIVNNISANDEEPLVVVRDVSFEMSDGVPRHEQMIARENKLTIENSHDGYIVVFDFDKQLVVLKNRTTSSCYFTSLDDFPVEMKMDNLSANLPIFFNEVSAEDSELLENPNTIAFLDLKSIPSGYLELTSTEICADGLSFWVEPMEGQFVRLRRNNCDNNCTIIVTVAIVAIVALSFG